MRIATLCLFLACASPFLAQTWQWEKSPVVGDNILIHINDAPDEEGMNVVYYCFEGTQLVSTDAGMPPTNNPGQLHAAIPMHDHMSWVRVVLKSSSGEILSGDDTFVQNDKALPEAGKIQLALAIGPHARTTGMGRNDTFSVMLFRDAIMAYPQWLEEPAVLTAYYVAAKSMKSEPDLEQIRKFIKDIPAKTAKSNEALMVSALRAIKDMGDTITYQAMRKQVDKTFPRHLLLQEEMLAEFRKTEDVTGKIMLRDKMRSQFGVTRDNTPYLDQMTSTIVQSYATSEDWPNATKYIMEIIDPMTQARVCNQYAWTLSGESIDAPAPHLDVAHELAAHMMKVLASHPEGPAYYTKSEWQRNLDYARAQYGDTYALILFKMGKVNEAIDHQAFSVQQYAYGDFDMNERYAMFLHKAGRTAELETFMDKVMVMGKASGTLAALHRQYWTQSQTQEELYASYLHQIEARAKARMIEELSGEWLDVDAKAFMLKDLQGNEVSLTDYAGKTVVLDFWATWCGPCKASFPGMQQAVNDFSASEDVVFLFIDTWERGDDVDARVSKFIADNKYTFHVLMDRENKIVTDYGVEGIPTKFVIGPDQKIRFKSVGFSGNNEELVKELKVMIEMARGQAKA